MKVIITTYDGHRNILEANKYMMDKMGGENLDVTILGFKKPDFDLGSWKFVSMGEYKGAGNFSNDILEFFNNFEDEYFIMGNDDVVLTEEINFNFLDEIIETIKTIPNFGRIWLTPTSNNSLTVYGGCSKHVDFGDYYIGELNQGANYRLSLQYSLWKTSYFKKHIRKNLSPWDWELRNDAKYDGAKILIPINNYVFNFGHIMRKGTIIPNWYKSLFNDKNLTDEDKKNVTEILTKHKII